jgi:hypothetical protein
MAAIDLIWIKIKTSKKNEATTKGRIYLSLGGREFRINANSEQQFTSGSTDIIQIGEKPIEPDPDIIDKNVIYTNINNEKNTCPTNNNTPTLSPVIDESDIIKYSKYIYFEPATEDDELIIEDVDLWPRRYDGSWMDGISCLSGVDKNTPIVLGKQSGAILELV